jgi:hypothetical protein
MPISLTMSVLRREADIPAAKAEMTLSGHRSRRSPRPQVLYQVLGVRR